MLNTAKKELVIEDIDYTDDNEIKGVLADQPVKRVLLLLGLSCSSCASKIEEEIKTLPGVKNAAVDFISKKLTIEAINKNEINKVVENAIKIARRIENGLNIIEDDKHRNIVNEGLNKNKLYIYGISAAIFLIAFIFKFQFWLEFGLYFACFLLSGSEVIISAFKNITKGKVFDENFLMSIATIGAFSIKEFSEGAAVMLFYQLGELLQEIAVNRSRRSISELMDIRPDYANLKSGMEVIKVSPEEIKIGDIIIIKPGEKVPLDGRVIEGYSSLDQKALTGESLPREVETGSLVYSGSINVNGVLTVEVMKLFGESTVTKILDLVENAGSKKAPTENFITKFSRYYTPVVVISAAILAFIPPLLINGATFSQCINRALVFLVVSCPCALVISIPLSFFGGIGGASKSGILIKGSNYLEALNNVEAVVFDKTGTLTKGVFKVTKVIKLINDDDLNLLEYAAYAESYSNHPIALSILEAYGKEVDRNNISNYEEIPGYGISANIKGINVLAGNSRFMAKNNISYSDVFDSGTLVHVAIEGEYAGYIVIADEIKQDSIKAIEELRNCGVKKLMMLTGDNKAVGEKIGRELNLDEVYSELLPDQKVQKLEEIAKQKLSNGKLIFIGDGINDAPVLARADVGIAMGGIGADAAIEAADIVLMTDEPLKIVSAIKIAKRTRSIVWQNIIFAMGIKVIVLILGAGGVATIWEAVFADVGVAVLAVLNAMRVMNIKNIS